MASVISDAGIAISSQSEVISTPDWILKPLWVSAAVAATHTMQIRVIKTLERGRVQELKFISSNRKWMSTDKRLLSRLRFVDVWSTVDSELQKYSLFRILISLPNTYTVAACLLFLKLYLYLEILPALKSLSHYWSRKCVMAVISNFRSNINFNLE